MIQHKDPLVKAVGDEIADHLADIERLFKPGARLTLVVRRPNFPEQDVVVTNDLIGDAIEAMRRRMAADAAVAGGTA